jgi:ectoine hydroxylase-related dioxygenase (phytanoyl-CoA dioxygenase family)
MGQGGVVDGVPVTVVEMTGEPGDVFFMHPSLMHAFSTNAGDQARMMLTQWVEGRPGAAYGLS